MNFDNQMNLIFLIGIIIQIKMVVMRKIYLKQNKMKRTMKIIIIKYLKNKIFINQQTNKKMKVKL